MNSVMNTYARLPVTFKYGKGAILFDENNNAYLDALSGIAVCSLGHAHPAVTQAICEQSKKLIHTSNLYEIGNQQALADNLTSLSNMDKVFFCNSGAEANETAIKIAKKFGNNQKISHPKIIVMENSFHGRTLATLSATGNNKVHEGFHPLVNDFIRVPFDNIDAIQDLSHDKSIVAILVEPIQGEGGVHIPQNNYLTQIRSLCDQNNWLMMLDEIQTGIGRTGKWFAHQYENIVPDIMTLAKALGNGMPIGACCTKGQAANILVPGNHGTTFGGNPLACAAALAVLNTLQNENIIPEIERKGKEMIESFKNALSSIPGIKQIRGKGYMIGIQLDKPCTGLVKKSLELNLLINVTRGDTIRLLPPFVMSDKQIKEVINKVTQLITQFYKN